MATQDGVRLLRVIFGSVCVCAREKGYSYWIGAFYLLPSSHTHTHTRPHTCVSAYPQSCPTLCNPLGCSPPGYLVHGIFQARILEWVAIPSPGDLPDPGVKPVSPVTPALQVYCLPAEPQGKPHTHTLTHSLTHSLYWLTFSPHAKLGSEQRFISW